MAARATATRQPIDIDNAGCALEQQNTRKKRETALFTRI